MADAHEVDKKPIFFSSFFFSVAAMNTFKTAKKDLNAARHFMIAFFRLLGRPGSRTMADTHEVDKKPIFFFSFFFRGGHAYV